MENEKRVGATHGQSFRLGSRARKTMLTAAAMMCCFALAATMGCQPASKATTDNKAANASASGSAATSTIGMNSGLDSGAWSDTQYGLSVNAGNRGCNSCHADLFSVLPDGEVGSHEVYKQAAYGKVYTYNDCISCHGKTGDGTKGSGATTSGGSGPYMAASIHGYHFSSEAFISQMGGSCFSCHETDPDTGELGMWDTLKYTRFIGMGTNAIGTETWIAGRGYSTGTVTGGATESNIVLTNATTNQDASDASDLYGATNMDFPEIDEATYTVTVKGVKNEKSFTLDELRAMPQTSITWTEMCLTNGQNGGWYVTNIPTTGVLISDIVEACGGYADGVKSFAGTGYDGWGYAGESSPMYPTPTTYDITTMLDPNAMIALEYFGENIDAYDGGPALFVIPGAPAMTSTKWVSQIDFLTDEASIPTVTNWGMNTIESANFFTPSKDGDTYKVGQTVKLDGYAFAYAEQGANVVESIELSADYGLTWTTIDIPASYDVDQWIRWYADWTPQVAGTYCLTVHVNTVNDYSGDAANDGHVLITVTE